MPNSLRIAVDSLVARANPDLVVSPETPRGAVSIGVFEAFESPDEIARRFTELDPDVIVVDSAWLVAAATLELLATLAGVGRARRVVGSNAIDDVLKIQTAYRGMHDIVDLTESRENIISRLGRISMGFSSLNDNELWRRVPRPPKFADITTVPQDAVDLSILELICIGYRDHDIAETLHYSVQAVKNRIGQMLKRSGVSNRTQLAWQFTNQLLTARMTQNIQVSANRRASSRRFL